ncbi:hypothetical protein WN72_24495 [Bradyrhizobium arachidis]|uniref:Uncharacterized protein n=1 Tax=Bradyrhizobium arachidis TaxID=858423 RepID=A0AAE7NUQ0_9BRAD|nr:hypothetical protein WN72_24495 [Bradyrhizobium arachidis]
MLVARSIPATGATCEKCVPLDKQIARYRFLEGRINDQKALDGIKRLIAELHDKKKANHPDE